MNKDYIVTGTYTISFRQKVSARSAKDAELIVWEDMDIDIATQCKFDTNLKITEIKEK